MQATRLGDDERFACVLLGVQNLVRNASFVQLTREILALFDADGADEHRLADVVFLSDVVDHGVELCNLALVDQIGLVDTCDSLVRGNRHDLQSVGVHQFGGFGLGRTCHARELVVHAEVVLERDRGESLVLFLDLHALLRLDRLVDAFAPSATLEDAARELVDDLHFARLHDVVLVALVELFRLERDLQLMHEVLLHAVVEVRNAELLFDLFDS